MQAHPEVASASTAGATDEPFAETVDDIVAQLRDDPVLLTQTMGNGATDEIDAALHAKLDQAQYPVYVVLTRTPTGVSGSSIDEELTSIIHARLERTGDADGVYLVHTTRGNGHLAVYGDVDPAEDNDDTLVSLARYTATDQVFESIQQTYDTDAAGLSAAAEAGIVLDIAGRGAIPDHGADVLTPEQVAAYTEEAWVEVRFDYDGPPPELASPGLTTLVGVTVGLVVSVLAYRLLRALGPRAARRPGDPRPAGVSARRQRELDRAALLTEAQEELERLDRALADDRSATVAPERLALALGSRDTALELVESDDALDLVGARVLALTGSWALGKDGATTYRPCYVDPRHGRARQRADLPGGLSVPVCRPCQRDLDAGREPTALRDERRGRDRPYYTGDTVWARTGFGALTDDLWRDVQRERTR